MRVQIGNLTKDGGESWMDGYVEAPDLTTPVVGTGQHEKWLAEQNSGGGGEYGLKPEPLTLRALAMRTARSTRMLARTLED